MSVLEELKTKGDIVLASIEKDDIQYLHSSPVDPQYYLEYRVIRPPYLNLKGVWEWVCKSTSTPQAFMIFRITPGLDDAPLVFTYKPEKAKKLT